MILVVGGAGHIGSHGTKLLNKSGFKTVSFDNLVRGHEAILCADKKFSYPPF